MPQERSQFKPSISLGENWQQRSWIRSIIRQYRRAWWTEIYHNLKAYSETTNRWKQTLPNPPIYHNGKWQASESPGGYRNHRRNTSKQSFCYQTQYILQTNQKCWGPQDVSQGITIYYPWQLNWKCWYWKDERQRCGNDNTTSFGLSYPSQYVGPEENGSSNILIEA